jgi:hypothetical protein
MMVVHLDCLVPYHGTASGLATLSREQWEQMESNHHREGRRCQTDATNTALGKEEMVVCL